MPSRRATGRSGSRKAARAAEVAVTTYHGLQADIDLAHAQLASYIAERELVVGWQLRE
jgi:hypothetical protein